MGYDPSLGVNSPDWRLQGNGPDVDPMWGGGGYPGYEEVQGGPAPYNPSIGVNPPGLFDNPGGGDTSQGDWSWLTNLLPGGSGGGGNDWGSYLQNIVGNPRDQMLLASSLGMAAKQWNDADKYTTKTEEWAKQANPFGDQRAGYGQQLAALYADPNSLKDNPAYKFALDAGMNALGPQQAASGGGWGNQNRAMVDYASGAATKVWNDETNRLAKLAGADIGPETAARLQMGGLDASVKSQNAALGAAMFPFGAGGMMGGNGPGQNNNRTGGGSNGGSSGGSTGVGGTPFSAAQIAQLAQKSGLSPAAVLNQLKYMGNGPEAAEFIKNFAGYAKNPMELMPGMDENPYTEMQPMPNMELPYNPDFDFQYGGLNDITGGLSPDVIDFSAFGYQDLGF